MFDIRWLIEHNASLNFYENKNKIWFMEVSFKVKDNLYYIKCPLVVNMIDEPVYISQIMQYVKDKYEELSKTI